MDKILLLAFLTFLATSFFQSYAQVTVLEGISYQSNKKISLQASQLSNTELKGTAVIFVSTKCPCSKSYFAHLEELFHQYHFKIQFAGIHANFEENELDAQKYFQRFSLPVIRDQDQKYANLLGALKTPHAYLLDKEGNIIFSGSIGNSRNAKNAKVFFLKDAIKEHLEGKNITVKNSRGLGCRIKRNNKS